MSSGLTQAMDVPTWKWEVINMDFVVEFPQTRRKNYSILVTVDRVVKSSHFIPVKSKYSAEEFTGTYSNCIVIFHDIHLSIISYRGAQFTSRFLEIFS